MLLVNARKGPSRLHGSGVIAREFIPRGTPVWRFRPGLDVLIPKAEYDRLPDHTREQVYHYAYFHEATRAWVLSGDDDRFTNHADDPTCRVAGDHTVAVRDIAPGDELTNDYHDLTWLSPHSLGGPCRAFLAPSDIGRGLFAASGLGGGEAILTFQGPLITLAELPTDVRVNYLRLGVVQPFIVDRLRRVAPTSTPRAVRPAIAHAEPEARLC